MLKLMKYLFNVTKKPKLSCLHIPFYICSEFCQLLIIFDISQICQKSLDKRGEKMSKAFLILIGFVL